MTQTGRGHTRTRGTEAPHGGREQEVHGGAGEV